MNYENKKIFSAYLIPSLVLALIVAIVAVMLDSIGIELGYTSPVGLILIALGGISTAFFGARFQYKYNNKSIKDIVSDFFSIKQPPIFYLLVILFLFLDFVGVITGLGFEIDNPVTPLLIFLKAILFGGIEEIGWRYTFQPEMEKRFSYKVSTFMTFLAWSVWHILYFCIDGSIYFYSDEEIVFFLIGLLTNCFILSVIYKKSGSLWLCVMTHALINTGAQLSPYVWPLVSVICSLTCIRLACVIASESKKIDVKGLSSKDTAEFFFKYKRRTLRKYLISIGLLIVGTLLLFIISAFSESGYLYYLELTYDMPWLDLIRVYSVNLFIKVWSYSLFGLIVVLLLRREIRCQLILGKILSEDLEPHKYIEVFENLQGNRKFYRGKIAKYFYFINFYVASFIYEQEYDTALEKIDLMQESTKGRAFQLAGCEYYKGAIAIGKDNVEEAEKCLEKIKELVGNNKGITAKNSRDIIIGLTGEIALKNKDYVKAEALISQRLAGRKDRISKMSLTYGLGKAKQGLGKEDEARKCFEEAAKLAGDATFKLADKIREEYKNCIKTKP